MTRRESLKKAAGALMICRPDWREAMRQRKAEPGHHRPGRHGCDRARMLTTWARTSVRCATWIPRCSIFGASLSKAKRYTDFRR